MKKVNVSIKGMHCGSCEMLIADALEEVGVKSKVDSKKGTAELEFDETKINLDKIKEAIKKEGFDIE
mgnify:CR=1 FL=1|tara:strand:- start:192 stop:392 length:201 start_codon:yes stop_codon:yes gene_type:complete